MTTTRSLTARFQDYMNKKLNPSRQELLATQDVTIVTQKQLRIYAWSNLVCFVLQLTVFACIQWINKLQAINIFHF